jgi:hypothetical protein
LRIYAEKSGRQVDAYIRASRARGGLSCGHHRRAPKPLPGTRRWDRKAIDLALDQISGIPSVPLSKEEEAEKKWVRDYEARNAARERDPEYIQKRTAREATLVKRRGRRKERS